MHLFSDFIGCYLSPRPTYFSPSTPGSHSRRKKRRTEAVRQLAQNDGGALGSASSQGQGQLPSTSKKARSSIGEHHHHLRSSGSFLLDTPDKKKRGDTASASSRADLLSPHSAVGAVEGTPGVKSPSPGAKTVAEALSSRPPLSARHQVFAELVQTEENYVSILRYC